MTIERTKKDMFGLPKGVLLHDVQFECQRTAELVELVELDRKLARLQIDDRWWSEPWITREVRRQARQTEGDWYWKWRKLVGEFQSKPKHLVKSLAVRTDDQEIQGAMIFDANRESVLEKGVGTVYIEYVATAPRNREKLSVLPLYRGTGTALLLVAMHYSNAVGFDGRVTLTAIPSALEWYIDKQYFVDAASAGGGNRFLELKPEQASSALQRHEREGTIRWPL